MTSIGTEKNCNVANLMFAIQIKNLLLVKDGVYGRVGNSSTELISVLSRGRRRLKQNGRNELPEALQNYDPVQTVHQT